MKWSSAGVTDPASPLAAPAPQRDHQRARERARRGRLLLESVPLQAGVLAAVAFSVYPLLWVIGLAVRPGGLGATTGVFPLGGEWTLDHFRALVGSEGVKRWLFATQAINSLVVSLTTAFLSVAIAVPAAYALARFRFLGARTAMRLLLWTQLFPAVAAAVPLYLLLDALHLLDSRAGLVLVYATTAVPFAIFQLRGAFEGIPVELEEAAMIDGASRFQAFLRVSLPAARPAIAVTALFAFMAAWNEFILAATFLSREPSLTLPVVLQRYVGEYDADWGAFAAGAIVVSVPVMVLFYIAQRHIVAGLTSGSVKG